MKLITVLILILGISVFAYAESSDIYIVPVTKSELKTYQVMSQKISGYETVCILEKCYFIVDRQTAEELVYDGKADGYSPAVKRYLYTTWTTRAASNDPLLNNQWYLTNNAIGWEKGKDIIDSSNLSSTSHTAPVVAVIDTGFTTSHLDMGTDKLYNRTHYGVYDNDAIDQQGHGTHVSGIIAAATGNNIGMASAGYGKGLVMSVKASRGTSEEFYSSDVLKALEIVINEIQKGAKIIAVNMSLGGDDFDQAEYDAMLALRDLGVLVVTAAGNGNSRNTGYDLSRTPTYPASYDSDNIISVAALTTDLHKANYSNYGGATDIAAPGDHILSLSHYYTISEAYDDGDDRSRVLVFDINDITTDDLTVNNWTYSNNRLTLATSGSANSNLNATNNSIIIKDIELGQIADKDYRTVIVEYSELCKSCSINIDAQINGSTGWTKSTCSDVKVIETDYIYCIPENANYINLRVSVGGTNTANTPVIIDEINVSGSNYADTYEYKSGTSMAAPYVAGVLSAGAALHPEATAAQLLNLLYNTADSSSNLSGYVNGNRRINIYAFLQAVESCKNAGSACKASKQYPSRNGTVSTSTGSPNNSSSSGSSGSSCSINGKSGGLTDLALLLMLPLAFIIRRKLTDTERKNG